MPDDHPDPAVASPRQRLAPPDLRGLIWGYRFAEDGTADALDFTAARAAIESGEGWVWLHLDAGDQRTRRELESGTFLPREIADFLMGTDDRQRLVRFDDVFAGVVADFAREQDFDPRTMVSWRFCMAPHLFVSTRRHPVHTMRELHDAVLSGRRFGGVPQLFDAIVHAFTGALGAVSTDLAARLDTVEDGMLDERQIGDFEELGAVRRSAVRLHRQAQPLRAMLHHMVDDRPPWFTNEAAEDCMQVSRRVESVTADLVALQERAHALQDELASRQTEQTNRRLMLLSVISAVLLPPTLISGIFGMNVEGLPFKDNPEGFLLVGVVMVVSVAVLFIVLRRMRLV